MSNVTNCMSAFQLRNVSNYKHLIAARIFLARTWIQRGYNGEIESGASSSVNSTAGGLAASLAVYKRIPMPS